MLQVVVLRIRLYRHALLDEKLQTKMPTGWQNRDRMDGGLGVEHCNRHYTPNFLMLISGKGSHTSRLTAAGDPGRASVRGGIRV